MKFQRILLTSILIFTFLIATPSVKAEWWINDGGEDILLDRVDDALVNDPANPDPAGPWHELDAGTYGYWDSSVWNEVITDGVINTAYSNVEWHPGTLDYIPQ